MMINTISETMDLYGVTPSVGRLYAMMYFKHHPMTLDEMKEELGMSKASMSTSVKKLQEINIVQKIWQKGSKRDLFTAEKNFFHYFSRFYGNKWEREVRMFLASIQRAETQLKEVVEDSEIDEELREHARLDYEQLQEAQKYYYWLDRLTKLVQSGEIFDYIPIKDLEDYFHKHK
ncbi:GbsR/MarR family transcriptional regulator [Virgibacillus sp. MSP4-1]|uniref:choline uptake/conversion transcriptional regulator CudC n=1 Tax=Virgibacillus sp. MSP4-1 TaxID=2700081 RepID=UPI00137BA4B8|nr:GbsR/MarR family transcriptional regulator [Virgibacillus sp. MSP4-1]QHS24568.1 GbsR/MarR family transcriptional regulator [Virgibacillus sp. MSP4-1]